MSIRIREEKCIGCGRCTIVCPGTLIHMADGKARMKYPRDCWGCTACVKECRQNAIDFFLGEDIGGSDVYMHVTKRGPLLDWEFYDHDKPVRTITVNSMDSNKY